MENLNHVRVKKNSIKKQERFCFTVLTDMRAKYIKFEVDEK